MRRRTMRIAFAIGLLLGAGVAVGIQLGDPWTAGQETVVGTESGLNVTLSSEQQLPSVFAGSDGETLILKSGNLSASGSASARVDTLNGTFTTVSQLDVDQHPIAIAPVDKPQVATVGGAADTIGFRQVVGNPNADGSVDFRYTASGVASVTVGGLEAGRSYQAIALGSGDRLATGSAGSSGTVTFPDLPSGDYDVDVRTFDASVPQIVESTGVPNSSQGVSGQQITLAANVTDADFPDEDLDITFSIDGNQVHTTTVSEPGRVEYTLSSGEIPAAGEHTWTMQATDRFGNTDTASFALLTPSDLTVRDITNKSIVKPATVRVEFFPDGEVIERQTTTGNISLDGLPAGQPFLVEVESDGYYTRSAVIESLISQKTAYITPKNGTDVVESEFTLNDLTGDFPSQGTFLLVKRNLNESKLSTVAGGQFGAVNRVPVTLIRNEQFRLELIGPDGDRRVLGGYESNTAGVSQLRVGEIKFEVPDGYTVALNSSFENTTTVRDDEPTAAIRFALQDQDQETQDLSVTIHERGNVSNEIFTDYVPGPLGNYSTVVTLNGTNQTETNWVIDYEFRRNGETKSGTIPVGQGRVPVEPLPDFWQSVLAVGAVLIVGGLFSVRNVAQGAVVVPLVAGFMWMVDWMPTAIGAGSIVLALALGVVFNYLRSAGGTT